MLKKNSFTGHLQKFLVGCSDIAHMHYFAIANARKTEERIAAAYKKFVDTGNAKHYRTGTALTLIDLFSKEEWVQRAAAEVRATEGADVLKLAAEAAARANAYVVVALHEAFEVFLQDVYGTLLFQRRGECTLRQKQAFHKAHPKMTKVEGTPQYYRAYAKFECKRDCDKAIAALFAQLDMKSVVLDRWGDMSFEEVIAVVGFCRHRIVHVDGVITPEALTELSVAQKNFVKRCLRKGVLTREPQFLPDHATTKGIIEILASVAYALYVLLGRQCAMKIDYGPQAKRSR